MTFDMWHIVVEIRDYKKKSGIGEIASIGYCEYCIDLTTGEKKPSRSFGHKSLAYVFKTKEEVKTYFRAYLRSKPFTSNKFHYTYTVKKKQMNLFN